MKSRTLTCIAAITLFAALAIPVRLAAQDKQEHNKKHKHHHYQVIDIGTFGGPQSYFNSLNLTDVFGFGTVFYNLAQVRNAQGVFVGFADTNAPDPYPAFCYVPDCFVTHAFQLRNGIKTDLGDASRRGQQCGLLDQCEGVDYRQLRKRQNGSIDSWLARGSGCAVEAREDPGPRHAWGKLEFLSGGQQPGPGNGTCAERDPRSLLLLLPVPILFPVPDLPAECNRDTSLRLR